MNKIKNNWLTIVLILSLLGLGYINYQDKEEIETLESKIDRLESDKSVSETRVIELEEELEDCKSDLRNTEVIETPSTTNSALEYMKQHEY